MTAHVETTQELTLDRGLVPAAIHSPQPIVGFRDCRTGQEQMLSPAQRRFALGSGPGCDIVVDDPFVSALHCVLEQRASGRTLIRDRRSRNGTFVNGNRIELAEIRPGTLLRIGSTTLVALGQRGHQQRKAIEMLRGEHPAFRHAIDMALRAAVTDCSVLVVGETGTGKELVAAAIHESSPRANSPLVAVNCGAISRELIGSELFGHEKGAFTGAATSRDGVFVQAGGGTLFLDELGELPLEQQPHLLRVLETRTVRRIGGNREEPIDVRLVAATNRIELVGKPNSPLRLDLFHRVATVVVHLPPLRERPSDIPLLVRGFIDEFSREMGPRTINRATLNALCTYSWPGNVRELRQAVMRGMALCPDELTIEHLMPQQSIHTGKQHCQEPARVRPRRRRRRATRACTATAAELRPIDLIIRDVLLDALDRHPSIRSAADSLGLPKSTFADWARRLGILNE